MSRIVLGRLQLTVDWPRVDVTVQSTPEAEAYRNEAAWGAVAGVLTKKGYYPGNVHGEALEEFAADQVSILRPRRSGEYTGEATTDARDLWLGLLDRRGSPGHWTLYAYGASAAEELMFLADLAERNGIELTFQYGMDHQGRLYKEPPCAPTPYF